MSYLTVRLDRRGFALVSAIGVLAILMIFAIATAATSRFTMGFAQARASDRALGSALEQSAAMLIGSKQELLKASATSPPVVLFGAADLQSSDVAVTATIGLKSEPQLSASLPARDGDIVVLLEAKRVAGKHVRTATYLLNSSGNRRVPILLQESRL